jgi:hypothetical protein
MKDPTRRLFGMTWIGLLNFFLLRWLWLRFFAEVDSETRETVLAFGMHVRRPGSGYPGHRDEQAPIIRELFLFRVS